MLFSIGILLLALTRWAYKRRQKDMYTKLLRQFYKNYSVYVRKPLPVLGTEGSSLRRLIQSSLLSGNQDAVAFEEVVALATQHISLSGVRPKKCVQLGKWTSYYHLQGQYHPQASGEDFYVLLEAHRPSNTADFLQRQLEIAPVDKVHVLSLGAAIAWHSGDPFGIILHCSLDEFVTLMIAFEDGCLSMDEDLEVSSIMTVDKEGEPASFAPQQQSLEQTAARTSRGSSPGKAVRPKTGYGRRPVQNQSNNSRVDSSEITPQLQALEEVAQLSRGSSPAKAARPKTASSRVDNLSNNSRAGSESMLSGTDQMTERWSNESLASSTSVGKAELLDMSEVEGGDNYDNENDNDIDPAMMESGAGEELSEMEFGDSSNSETLSQSWGFLRMNSVSKPPNLLVYTGKIDSVRKFEKVQAVLEQCLNNECYVIYHLKHEEIATTPWMDNTALLVVQARKVYNTANRAFLKYFQSGGKIFCMGSGFSSSMIGLESLRDDVWISEISYKSWSNVPLIVGSSAYDLKDQKVENVEVERLGQDKDGKDIIVKVSHQAKTGSGRAILSQVLFDKDPGDLGVTPEFFNTLKKSNEKRFEILRHLLTSLGIECSASTTPPTLTGAALLTRDQALRDQFMQSIEKRLSDGLLKTDSQSLHFTREPATVVIASETLLPVGTGETDLLNFSVETYFKYLESKVLGNTVIYVDVVPTTMTILDGLLFSVPQETGLIAIARQQTSGKGRGGNSWLSPVGCAMFTLHVRIPLDSELGRAVSFLQHITSLAVVYSVNKLPGHQDIDLRLKWPNDIYYGSMMKLGGVIVKSTIMDGIVHATIGCGFNVSNSNPTICINDLIQLHNRQVGDNLQLCSTEQLIGQTVSHIEKLIGQFQTDGCDSFKNLYYEKWLHSDRSVILQSEGDKEVTIVGLDDYGYLQVKSQIGEIISVQPDGNSFDMMKNLISLKTR